MFRYLASLLLLGALASTVQADVNTGQLAARPTLFKCWDLDDAVYRTVGSLTPDNSPVLAIPANMLTVGGTSVVAATRFTAYGAGVKYALTNTAAAIDLGTTDPVITITTAGTYRLSGRVKLTYTGATVVAETATVKLRRTNNTAADVTDASYVIDLPAATTLTHDWGWVPFDVYYTTANADDAITVFGNVSATLGAGAIDVNAVYLIAERVQ